MFFCFQYVYVFFRGPKPSPGSSVSRHDPQLFSAKRPSFWAADSPSLESGYPSFCKLCLFVTAFSNCQLSDLRPYEARCLSFWLLLLLKVEEFGQPCPAGAFVCRVVLVNLRSGGSLASPQDYSCFAGSVQVHMYQIAPVPQESGFPASVPVSCVTALPKVPRATTMQGVWPHCARNKCPLSDRRAKSLSRRSHRPSQQTGHVSSSLLRLRIRARLGKNPGQFVHWCTGGLHSTAALSVSWRYTDTRMFMFET